MVGCNAPKKKDPLVQFVLAEHRTHFKQELPEWEAEKIVLAVRTFAPPERVSLVLACGAVESHFKPGEVGDDGRSLGIYQVQHQYHRNVSRVMLRWNTTTNTREAVQHLRAAGWSARVYNAGETGAKKGKGRSHEKKVLKKKKVIDDL